MADPFRCEETNIPGLKVVYPFIATDDRGYYMKYYERNILKENGISLVCHEEAQSKSKKGVIRGLHFQTKHPQAKLVRVVQGEAFDVAVDLRTDSPTFGRWAGFFLSAENRKMVYIPAGFAHGLMALTEDMLLSYISGDDYDPTADCGIRWDDPDIGIQWPLHLVERVILSEKDKRNLSFEEYKKLYRS